MRGYVTRGYDFELVVGKWRYQRLHRRVAVNPERINY